MADIEKLLVALTLLVKPLLKKQGNYSLRRPPKLIIPQIFIEQRWTTVYRFMCKKICISNKANMTRALMRVQFWVNGQYSPRTEPTEQPIFTQNWTHWTSSVLGKRPIFTQNWTGSILGGRPIFTQNWTNWTGSVLGEQPIFTQNWTHWTGSSSGWTANIHPELNPDLPPLCKTHIPAVTPS